MDELACIRAFVRVVECGSFAAAGRLLRISKSVITKRINELESRVASQLLVRSTRRLTLTDAGSVYYERCARILQDVEEAREAVSSRSQGLVGALRLSCIASFTARQLSDDLARFQLAHPNLTVELHHNDRVYDPIQEGYDVCIQTTDIAGSNVVRRPVATLHRMLVSTPEYLARSGPLKTPADLQFRRIAHNNFITPGTGITLMGARESVEIPIRPVILSNSVWMIRSAVLNGDCIGLLPVYFILDELCAGRLIPVFSEYSVQPVTLAAYYRKSAHVPTKVRALLDFLGARYRPNPPWEQTLRAARPDLASLLR